MEMVLGPEILLSYKRLSYTHWYALAEFIDNSTQAYINSKTLMDKVLKREGKSLEVRVNYGNDSIGEFIEIVDNSIGMSAAELSDAVHVGKAPKISTGRSRYGIGLKTAACWFGDKWTIETTKLGDDNLHKITVDVPRVADNNPDLQHKTSKCLRSEHYTIIKIRNLHQRFHGRTVGKTKDYIRSIYRMDMEQYGLKIIWKEEVLIWDRAKEIDNRIAKHRDGKKAYTKLKLKIGNKTVTGWAGVLESGSRASAGFSIIQANRVITGWPSSYRPSMLFGQQEGGRNDLVNQRLLGELFLEGFDVSHTKDTILWSDDDEEVLDAKLAKACAGLKAFALSNRKLGADERIVPDEGTEAAVNEFTDELKSSEVADVMENDEVPPPRLLHKSNKALQDSIVSKIPATIKVRVGKLSVQVYMVEEMSPNDPYLLIDSTGSKTCVTIIINLTHPHWASLHSADSILNFVRHCTYDGAAEWKAYSLAQKLDPDTIKLIKDRLLRVPYEIEKHSP